MCKGILERVDMFPALISWQQKFREERKYGDDTNALMNKIADNKSRFESGHKTALNRQKFDDISFNNKESKKEFTNLLKPESNEEKENATWNGTFFTTALELQKAKKEGANDKLKAAQEARTKVLDSMMEEINFLESFEENKMLIDPDYFANNYVKLERLYRITEYFRDLGQNANSPDAFYLKLKDKYLPQKMADKAEYIAGLMHFNDVMRNVSKQYFMRGERQDLSDCKEALNHIKLLRKNAFNKTYKKDIEIPKISPKQYRADANFDFIDVQKIPIEKQLLKSSAELIEYRNTLLKSKKKIDPVVLNWLNTHIRHWQRIEYLRSHKPTQKPPRTITVIRNGQKINVDSSYVNEKDDEVVLDNVEQVGYQSHSLSCWSRVAQTLLNYQGVDIDQTEIRAFRRSDLNKNNYRGGNGTNGSLSVVTNSMGSIDMDVNELLLQTTDKVGFEVRQFNYNTVDIDTFPPTSEEIEAMQESIMEEVKRVILTYKVPIALLFAGHYRTIVGFKGKNTLLLKDPQDKSDSMDSNSIREVSIKDLRPDLNPDPFTPLKYRTGDVSLEWLQELTVHEDGSCDEVDDKSKAQANETKAEWKLENGKYRLKSVHDGSYSDGGGQDIGDLSKKNFVTTYTINEKNEVKPLPGFSIQEMFRFNTSMN